MENYNGINYILNKGSENVRNKNVPQDLLDVADVWYLLSKMVGDKGCCVLGAHMDFKYNETQYRMMPQSPWQGESSWTKNKDLVKDLLEKAGASDVNWEYGRMD